jgi:phosphoribosylformylglycinamidine synthase subunit PurQ / glutaminase
MMPHPENLIDPTAGGTDGLGLFQSLVSGKALAA